MKEVILCKYGEIVLKGNNRNQFEALLMKELRRRAADLGKYDIRYMQSTVYIEPADDEAEMNFDEMYARCGKIFGLENPLWALLLVVLGSMAVGFADDYIKVVKKRNLGLTAKQKPFLQLFKMTLHNGYIEFSKKLNDIILKCFNLTFYIFIMIFICVWNQQIIHFICLQSNYYSFDVYIYTLIK